MSTSKVPDGANALTYSECADLADLVAEMGQADGCSQQETIERASDFHINHMAARHRAFRLPCDLTAADCMDVRCFLRGEIDLPEVGCFDSLRKWMG